jgi:hypothetical protein
MTSRFDGVTEHYLASVVADGLEAGPVTKADLLARALQKPPPYPVDRLERFLNDLVDVMVRSGSIIEIGDGRYRRVK